MKKLIFIIIFSTLAAMATQGQGVFNYVKTDTVRGNAGAVITFLGDLRLRTPGSLMIGDTPAAGSGIAVYVNRASRNNLFLAISPSPAYFSGISLRNNSDGSAGLDITNYGSSMAGTHWGGLARGATADIKSHTRHLLIGTISAYDLVFGVNNNDLIYMKASTRNVGIGDLTDPSFKLHVDGTFGTDPASTPSGDLGDSLVTQDPVTGQYKRISYTRLPSGGSGETNTAANLGAGIGTYETKVGVQLQFNSLVSQTSQLTITEDDANDEIDFTLDLSGVIFWSDTAGGTGIASKTWVESRGYGSSSGESNLGANLGAGVGVFENKTGVTLNFNSLVSQSSELTISEDDPNDEIDLTLDLAAYLAWADTTGATGIASKTWVESRGYGSGSSDSSTVVFKAYKQYITGEKHFTNDTNYAAGITRHQGDNDTYYGFIGTDDYKIARGSTGNDYARFTDNGDTISSGTHIVLNACCNGFVAATAYSSGGTRGIGWTVSGINELLTIITLTNDSVLSANDQRVKVWGKFYVPDIKDNPASAADTLLVSVDTATGETFYINPSDLPISGGSGGLQWSDTTGATGLASKTWVGSRGYLTTAVQWSDTTGATGLASKPWVASRGYGTLSNIVEDTSPQLGGYLDVNGYGETDEIEYGATIAAGDLLYMSDDDGLLRLADASEDTTTHGTIVIAIDAGSNGQTRTVLERGDYTTTGLTKGAHYWVSETAGDWTSAKPSTAGTMLRYLGQAKSTTVLKFNPSQTWAKN